MDEEKSKQMTSFLTDFLEYLRACEGSGLPTIKVRRKQEENVFITSFLHWCIFFCSENFIGEDFDKDAFSSTPWETSMVAALQYVCFCKFKANRKYTSVYFHRMWTLPWWNCTRSKIQKSWCNLLVPCLIWHVTLKTVWVCWRQQNAFTHLHSYSIRFNAMKRHLECGFN